MTGCSQFFSTYTPCAGNRKIRIADGSLSVIAGTGTVKISNYITLHDVLHVPKLSCNLVSVTQITSSLNCRVIFYSSRCEFQDMVSGRTIGSARESGGLYFLEDGTESGHLVTNSCFNSISVSNNVMIWHYRLGHLSFYYLKHLLLDLFRNKSPSSFKCEICELAKHHRSSFPARPYQASKPFLLIHSDVWGPSRASTMYGKKWSVSFIDDHTRLTWVYLLRDNSEVKEIF